MTDTRIPLDSITAYAASLVSNDPYAPTLRCSYCAEEVDTYEGAHDAPVEAITAFLNHTAFDHTGRADILTYTPRVLGRVETLGESEYRQASEEPETGAQGLSEHIDAIEAHTACADCGGMDGFGNGHASDCPALSVPDDSSDVVTFRVTDSDRATMEAATEFDA